MPRLSKRTLVLAKLETTYGTDSSPTAAANAVVAINPSFELVYDSVERQVARQYLGAQQALHNVRFAKLTFEVELAPSGTAGTAPAFGSLLRACAMAQTVTANTSVEYSPITDSQESATLYFYLDGVQRKMLGCMGTFELSMMEGEIPTLKFDFTGIDAGIVEGAMPAPTLTAWKAPQLVSITNSVGLKFGATFSAGTLTGGTQYSSRGLSIALGNDVKQRRMLSTQSVAVVDRKTTGSVQMELTAAQEVALIGDINAQTLTGLSFEHSSTAGSKVLVWCPSVQRLSPKVSDQDGIAQMSADLTMLPSAGNDEFRLLFS